MRLDCWVRWCPGLVCDFGGRPCRARRAGPRSRCGELPPYNTPGTVARFTGDLRSLGIPRLDAEPDLAGKRPNIPLAELTGGRAERLLALLDRWIDDVRAHTTEPETTGES